MVENKTALCHTYHNISLIMIYEEESAQGEITKKNYYKSSIRRKSK